MGRWRRRNGDGIERGSVGNDEAWIVMSVMLKGENDDDGISRPGFDVDSYQGLSSKVVCNEMQQGTLRLREMQGHHDISLL